MAKAAKKPLPPTDENVKIPAYVLAAAARADELHKEAYEAPASEAITGEAPEVVATPAEPAPVVVAVPAAVEPAAPAAPAPAPAPVAAEPVVTPQSNVTPASNDWEHRYNSMKGRFDRSETANKQLVDRINGLEQVIATMHVTAPMPAAAAPAELDAASLITAAEREAYGDDFINLAGKVAQQKVSPKVSQLENEVKILRERLESVGTSIGKSARDNMHNYLNDKLPNWTQVNDNPEFISWLQLPDVYTGAIKHKLLLAAYEQNDAPRVLAFFQGFLSEEAALAPRPESQPASTAVAAAAKVPLETFAAPGRAKTAATSPVPAEKPIFTRAEITQFYVDVSNRKYVGRDEEKNRIEREIHSAGREGRIR